MRLKSTSSGSAALELVALITILLMPVGPMLALFSAVSDALAAESIARHGLRYAFLESGLGADPSGGIAPALQILAQSWGKEIKSYSLQCQACQEGGYLVLEVRVGSMSAMQSAGIEPW